eukprot:COSAG04_NODE_13461_length_605_cov_1.162055_1_plen_62_part_01
MTQPRVFASRLTAPATQPHGQLEGANDERFVAGDAFLDALLLCERGADLPAAPPTNKGCTIP